jgi:tetratricopeptide (TPR) repeat protein
VWQALRTELHPLGVEIVTVSLELSGPEVSRPFIEAANPDHPSLLDPTHLVDALFGVVNIPNVVWIDEDGIIVRPAEPGWAGPQEYPEAMRAMVAARAKRAAEAKAAAGGTDDAAPKAPNLAKLLQSGQDRLAYPDAIRDWARNGAASQYAMTPDQVIAASQPRPLDGSLAAAHFELANHLWRAGERDASIAHFNECHRLQPDNWTYKRQAWSLVGNERVGGGEFGRFTQVPLPGEEADWPFAGNFDADVNALEPGQYYPGTM